MDYSHENAGEIERGPRQLSGVYSGRIHFKPYMNCHGRQLRLLKYYQNGTAEAGGPFSPSIVLSEGPLNGALGANDHRFLSD
jgi:hypothetical protein